LRAELAAQGFTDLGGAYGYVFRALATEELSQSEVAMRLAITDQGMAKIIAEMESRGYVERRADPEDARIKRLRLAKRGRDALAAARRFHAAFERQLARREGADAVKNFRALLESVVASSGTDDTAHARLRPM
jgi:DNA-binding MarR family transcriptional regulator